MENLNVIILLSLFMIITASLVMALMNEQRKAKRLSGELSRFKGQNEDELYDRGKFSELGLMSAGITHEISNPLSIILGRVTQLERRTGSDSELANGLAQIKDKAQRIAKIVQSVREYIYRNEEAEEDFISLSEVIDKVLIFYGQRLKNHGIDLRLNNIDRVFVRGHRGQYEQAILNLISNSFDAIDNLPEKWIDISTMRGPDNVQIFFKDSGHGIPVDLRSKILDPFFSTKKSKGSGLGLPVVRGIAQKHGGDLRYVDAPNTTFLLELPQASGTLYHH